MTAGPAASRRVLARTPVAPLPASSPTRPVGINGRTSAPPDSSLPDVCSFQLPKVCSFRLPLTPGAQFTSQAFTTVLKTHAVTISMDARAAGSTTCSSSGSGASVKYEDVYLHAYETPASLRAGLTCYFQFYNGRRRHSSLGRRTPDVVYFGTTGFGTAA